MIDKHGIAQEFQLIQDEICAGLEALDGHSKFQEDKWDRPGGGGGRSRVITDGDLLQKGGVNFSAVHGDLPDMMVKELKLNSSDFFATGVSIVLHPNNPFVPIIHMNIRYFEMGDGTYWFGGGIDLTPHYIDKGMASQFHKGLKAVCDKYASNLYPDYKKWADDYFFNQHRNETRGVGGIFYDRQKDGLSKQEWFDLACDLGRAFVPLYTEQVDFGRNKPFTEANKKWQHIRRGRYVEFNLVYDRGTKFGLQTAGRIESILMSLPQEAHWYYNHQPEEGSEEFETLQLLKKDVDWVV